MSDVERAFYQVKMNDLLVKYKERGHVFSTHFDNNGIGLVLDGRFFHQMVRSQKSFSKEDFERLEAFLKEKTEER